MVARDINDLIRIANGNARDLAHMMLAEYGFDKSMEIVAEYKPKHNFLGYWSKIEENLKNLQYTTRKTRPHPKVGAHQIGFDLRTGGPAEPKRTVKP